MHPSSEEIGSLIGIVFLVVGVLVFARRYDRHRRVSLASRAAGEPADGEQHAVDTQTLRQYALDRDAMLEQARVSVWRHLTMCKSCKLLFAEIIRESRK